MPEPLSPKRGLGMKVAVLPVRRATLRMMYRASITWSALPTSGLGSRSISHWPRGGHLVEMGGRGDAAFPHALGHLGAEVHQAIRWRAGEIAEPRARLVAEVRRFRAASVPRPFHRIDMIERLVSALLEPHVVEDEELQLGGQQAIIGQARIAHVAGRPCARCSAGRGCSPGE